MAMHELEARHVCLISRGYAAIKMNFRLRNRECRRAGNGSNSRTQSAMNGQREDDADGPIAQSGQSRRLITGRSQVRILVGPLSI
jgi:hypothetical protein